MTWKLPVAAVQMTATDQLADNLTICRRLVGQAASAGARAVVLPECFAFLGAVEGDKRAAAESLDEWATKPGPIFAMLAEQATKHGVWIIGGGMPEAVAGDPTRTYNTAVTVSPQGALCAKYRKIHLFDVDIPGGAQLLESSNTKAGERELVVQSVDDVPVGMSICYDVRFPELYRKLMLAGAQVTVVPAAFTALTGKAHWHVLLRARAIEDQMWIVAAAQVGQHNPKRATFGHSMIIDPWGTVVAELPAGEGFILHELDGESVKTRRTQMPCRSHAVLL